MPMTVTIAWEVSIWTLTLSGGGLQMGGCQQVCLTVKCADLACHRLQCTVRCGVARSDNAAGACACST